MTTRKICGWAVLTLGIVGACATIVMLFVEGISALGGLGGSLLFLTAGNAWRKDKVV
jgi:hypothetical protein